MKFEWSPFKARSNLRKHRVSFEEARTVFADPFAGTGWDREHSMGEQRWVTLGISERGRLLVVSHLEHNGSIRIVSARAATKHEQKVYEED